MKTHINKYAYKQLNNKALLRKREITQNNDFKEKTTENRTTHRPAEAISFRGSISSAGQKALNGFVNSKTINGLIDKVYDNEAAFNAIYALIVAGILKPIAVINMPGSEDKDKQIVATKNFIQAFLGSFLSFTIGGGFIKKAVDIVKNDLKMFKQNENGDIETIAQDSKAALELAKDILLKENKTPRSKFKEAKTNYKPTIDEISNKAKILVENFNKNHKAIFEKNPEFTNLLITKAKNAISETEYSEAFDSFWKNSTGALTSIAKAKISSLLLPGVMAFLFAKKNLEKEQREKLEKEDFSTMLKRNSNFKNEQEKFQKFMNSKNSNLISFNGNLLNKAIYSAAGVIEKAGMSKPGEKLVKALSYAKKPSARMADIESISITAYWLQNTARSKKIDPSQKLGLNIHTALVTVVSSTCAFLIDWAMDGLIKKAKNTYSANINTAIQKTLDTHKDIIGKTLSKDTAPIIQMALDDACKSLIDSGKKIDDEAILKILSDLKQSNAIMEAINKGAALDEDIIKETIKKLKQTVPVKNTLQENCKNLLDNATIAKNLSQIDLSDSKAVEKEILKLTETYGKKLNKFKSLTIFTIVVRFLVPVLMVPISGKLKRKIVELTNHKNN